MFRFASHGFGYAYSPGIVSNSFLFHSQKWLYLDAKYVMPYNKLNSSTEACRPGEPREPLSPALATSPKKQRIGSKLSNTKASPRPHSLPLIGQKVCQEEGKRLVIRTSLRASNLWQGTYTSLSMMMGPSTSGEPTKRGWPHSCLVPWMAQVKVRFPEVPGLGPVLPFWGTCLPHTTPPPCSFLHRPE